MTTIKRDSMEATEGDISTQLKATVLSTPPRPSVQSSHLTTLPSSILNTIFSHLLDTELVNTNLPNVSYTHSLQAHGTLHFNASRPPFPVHTSLFYVNKSISEQARQYFYAQNLFIRLAVRTAEARHAKTMLTDSGILFSGEEIKVLERVKEHAMDILVTEKDSEKTRAVVLFPAQYLPRLVNFMDQASKASSSWSSNHKLEISVRNTYDFPLSRLQGDLLEPFRFLSNFSSVSIAPSHLLLGYAEGLQSSLTTSFTPDSWLSTISKMAEHADAARERKTWEEARQQFHSAIIALTYAYLTHPEDLHSQNEAFAKSIQRLRWRCEMGVGQSILCQYGYDKPQTQPAASKRQADPKLARDLLVAETALSSALSLSTDSPSPASNPWLATLPVDLVPPNSAEWFTDRERGETWYQLGLAHASLQEFLFAAGDMERAVRLLFQDRKRAGVKDQVEEVEGIFEWVRGEIDWEVKPGDGLRKAAKVARR